MANLHSEHSTQTLRRRPLLPKSQNVSRHTCGPKRDLIYANNINMAISGPTSTRQTELRAKVTYQISHKYENKHEKFEWNFSYNLKRSMTVTARNFTKIALARQFFMKSTYTWFHLKFDKGLLADTRSQDGRTWSPHQVLFSLHFIKPNNSSYQNSQFHCPFLLTAYLCPLQLPQIFSFSVRNNGISRCYPACIYHCVLQPSNG